MDRPWLPGTSGATLPASDTVNWRQCLGVTSRRWEDGQVASIARVTPATGTQALAKCFILSPVCCFAYFLTNFPSFSAIFCLLIISLFLYNLPLSSSPILHSFVYLFACTYYVFIPILFSVTVLPFLLTFSLFFSLILHFFPSFPLSLSEASTIFITSKMSQLRAIHKHNESPCTLYPPCSGTLPSL